MVGGFVVEAQKGQQICCNDASVLLKKMMSNRQVHPWSQFVRNIKAPA